MSSCSLCSPPQSEQQSYFLLCCDQTMISAWQRPDLTDAGYRQQKSSPLFYLKSVNMAPPSQSSLSMYTSQLIKYGKLWLTKVRHGVHHVSTKSRQEFMTLWLLNLTQWSPWSGLGIEYWVFEGKRNCLVFLGILQLYTLLFTLYILWSWLPCPSSCCSRDSFLCTSSEAAGPATVSADAHIY